jgi:uncharacterized protein involved in exopolysaccharide biosynthesis
MRLLPSLVLSVAFLAACGSRTPIYRANIKLLVARSGTTAQSNDLSNEDANRFAARQAEILLGQPLLRRTEQHMNKTAEEVRDNLANLKVTPVRGSNIIVVSVDSPSHDFAKDFANALVSEYLKFRAEQRAQVSQDALAPLVQETRRLKEELKAADEKLAAFEKAHNDSANPELSELRMLFENHEKAQAAYDTSLTQLMKADAAGSIGTREVSILEPAILEPNRIH